MTRATAERPRLIGAGPPSCSTCTAVAVQPEIVWDVNGYYRALGMSTRATRVQIKQAYLVSDQGARLTFVTKQLLDPVVRRAYDLTPLGSVFVDRYVVDQVRRASALRKTTCAGVQPVPPGVSGEVVLDTTSPGEQGVTRSAEWSYAFYLWGTDRSDKKMLAEWQEHLVRAAADRKEILHLAVGLRGGMAPPVEATVVGRRTVVFLHEDEDPTEALAQRAVDSLTTLTTLTTLTSPSHHSRDENAMTSTDTAKRASFRKGAEASQEASKGGANFAKTNFFSLDPSPTDPNNTAIVRFLTDKDDWIVVDQHNSVPTKGKPADYEGANWPEKMGAVCRADGAFIGIYHDGSHDSAKAACYICDVLVDGKEIKKAGGRTWAFACLREEVKGDGSEGMGGQEMKGKVLGHRDKTRKVAVVGKDGKPTGDEVEERAVVVVNMAYKNFFSPLSGFAGFYGTVCDRDYFIKRNGSDRDTTYQVIPMDPITLQDGSIFDSRNPEHAAKYGVTLEDLEDLVHERASDEFYGRFFDKRVTLATKQKGEGTSTSPQPPEKNNDADPGRMAALADRVKGYGPKTSTPAGTESSTDGEPTTPAATPAKTPASSGMRNFD